MLIADNHKTSFRQKVLSKFTSKVNLEKNGKKGKKVADKPARIKRIPLLILAKLLKEVKEISKYFKPTKPVVNNKAKNFSYVQASKTIGNTEEVLKIKEAFPSLKAKNINNIQKIINENNNLKPKSCLNLTTKGPLHKQVIVLMSGNNKKNFMNESNVYVSNMNRVLKNIKSNILVDFIIVVTNKVTSSLDLQTIKQYVKDTNRINSNKVNSPRLPQLKSYLKVIGLPYFQENTIPPITSNVVENILKENHIFNNIFLMSKPRVIKVFLKSDMAIIWIDIWDVQSGSNTKILINMYFNVGNYITTIQGANMNLGVPQYKNCWRWGHSTFSCQIQETKCVKYNGPHKSEHHRQFLWCYKANEKMNLPKLEMKKSKLYLHFFKYSNCQGDHQADSNICPFWRHQFNQQ